MPYQITRHSDDLLWIVMEGELTLEQAEAYFCELWALLDGCERAMDLLVDGRRIGVASPSARRRTEQVAHHPRLGHLAFVVREQHLLIFAPLMKLVSGIGLFGSEHEAIAYLRGARGLPPLVNLALPIPLPAATLEQRAPQLQAQQPPTPAHQPEPLRRERATGATRPVPPPPAPRVVSAPWPSRARPLRPAQARLHHAPPFNPGAAVLHTLTDILDGWTSNIHNFTRRIERN